MKERCLIDISAIHYKVNLQSVVVLLPLKRGINFIVTAYNRISSEVTFLTVFRFSLSAL